MVPGLSFPLCKIVGILPHYVAFIGTMPVATSCDGSSLILKCKLVYLCGCAQTPRVILQSAPPPPPFPCCLSRSSHFPYKRALLCLRTSSKWSYSLYRQTDFTACTHHHSALGTLPYPFSTNPISLRRLDGWNGRTDEEQREKGWGGREVVSIPQRPVLCNVQ